jgi:hypothetical protein
MGFIQKKINPTPHVGVDLIELREQAGLSRADVAARTKIPEFLIRALEEEWWEEIQDPVYFENMFRAYVEFLGGKKGYFLAKYRECVKKYYASRRPDACLPRAYGFKSLDFAVGYRLLIWVGIAAIVLAVFGFMYTRLRVMTAPPLLLIDAPVDGQTIEVPQIEVRGITAPEASVQVNGSEAAVASDGKFTVTLILPRGMTTLTIQAKKRHSRTIEEVRHVLFDRPMPAFEDVAIPSPLPIIPSSTKNTP